jgi:hypothetical protein
MQGIPAELRIQPEQVTLERITIMVQQVFA